MMKKNSLSTLGCRGIDCIVRISSPTQFWCSLFCICSVLVQILILAYYSPKFVFKWNYLGCTIAIQLSNQLNSGSWLRFRFDITSICLMIGIVWPSWKYQPTICLSGILMPIWILIMIIPFTTNVITAFHQVSWCFTDSDAIYCWINLGSSWWHPSGIACYCWVLHEAWLFSSNGPIHQAGNWECTLAHWSHYGWYPRAFCPRKDLHKQCCPHHEWWDHSQVPSINQEAHDTLPTALPCAALKISRIQQPGKWEWPAGASIRREWFG